MIYLDNNATTPLAPEVAEAMREAGPRFGNPSSLHGRGREARRLLDGARERVAEAFQVAESTLTFTSGATESLNAAMLGVFLNQSSKSHLIVSQVEHAAVLDCARYLETLGVEVTYLPVDGEGKIPLEILRGCLRPHTKMIAVMFANNEIGNLYPITEIGHIAREHGALYLCDAVQVVGKLPLNLGKLPVDFLTASAHKFHGPKGVGLLYVSPRVQSWGALLRGGRQERGRRAGTENVVGIVGMAKALELAHEKMDEEGFRVTRLRDLLEQGLFERLPDLQIHGDPEHRVGNTLNVRIPSVSGESLAMKLDLAGVAVSVGAACESGSLEASHVLLAMGLSEEEAMGGLRFSLSRYSSEAEIERVVEIVHQAVSEIEKISC